MRLLRFNAAFWKNKLANKLEVKPDDPGAFHLHAETTEEYARHMCAEYFDEEKRLWVCQYQRANHFWDCEVLCLVAADLLRVRFWPKPEEREQESGNGGRKIDERVVRSNFMSR